MKLPQKDAMCVSASHGWQGGAAACQPVAIIRHGIYNLKNDMDNRLYSLLNTIILFDVSRHTNVETRVITLKIIILQIPPIDICLLTKYMYGEFSNTT